MTEQQLSALKAKHGIKSNYQLAKELSVDESTISRGVQNGFSKPMLAALKFYFLYLECVGDLLKKD